MPSSDKPKAGQQVKEQPPVICIDERNGIFATPKDARGPRVPVHLKKQVVSGLLPVSHHFVEILLGLE